jgi:uncharacterized delta-60 repeat protein
LQTDGKIVVGGSFTNVGSTARSRIARLNSDSHLDLSFDAGAGANGTVNAVALTRDGKVLVAGAFSMMNGLPRGRIARLNNDGSVDAGFDGGIGPNGSVSAIAVQKDGKVLIGGVFQFINGIARNHVARLNPDGTVDPSFDPGLGADNTISAIALSRSGKIFVGGSFRQFNGLARDRVARLNGDLLMFDPIRAANTLSVSVSTFSDQTYYLELNHSLDQNGWVPVSSVFGDGRVQTLQDTLSADAPMFYRVRQE